MRESEKTHFLHVYNKAPRWECSHPYLETTDCDIVQWHYFPRKETKAKLGKLWEKIVKSRGIEVHHDVSPDLEILTDFVDVHAEQQQNA